MKNSSNKVRFFAYGPERREKLSGAGPSTLDFIGGELYNIYGIGACAVNIGSKQNFIIGDYYEVERSRLAELDEIKMGYFERTMARTFSGKRVHIYAYRDRIPETAQKITEWI